MDSDEGKSFLRKKQTSKDTAKDTANNKQYLLKINSKSTDKQKSKINIIS